MGGAAITMYEILLELRRKIHKKHVVIGVLSIIFLVLLITFLRGGFIIIHAPKNNSVTGYHQKSGSDEAKLFEIKKDSWKLLYLENGNYSIEAIHKNSESLYYKSVHPFSILSVDIVFKPQKESINLGYQDSDCIVPSNTQQIVWYGCEKSKESNYQYSLTVDGINYESKASAPAVALYQNGVIELNTSEAGNQFIRHLSFDNNNIKSSQNNGYDLKNSSVSKHSLITDTYSSHNPRFAYFNDEENVAYLFKNFSDNNPTKLSLNKYTENNKDFTTNLKIRDNRLYIVNGGNSDTFMGHNENTEDSYDNQRLSVINLETNKLDYQMQIPKNLLVIDYSIKNNGLIIFNAVDINNGDKNLYTIQDEKIKSLSVKNGASGFCVYKDSVYYISDLRDGTIYQYSTTKAASFLAYKNEGDNIAGIQCSENGIYFYTLSNASPESDYRWFKLEDSKFEGSRVESSLPILDDNLSGIDYAYPFKNSLIIKLKNDGSCSVTTDEKDEVVKYLRNNAGVNTDKFKINISREC